MSDDAQKQEAAECLDLIASESRRCGDLVKNLLTFSRTSPMNLAKHALNEVIARCVRLIEHKAEISGIHLQVDTDPNLPEVYCDAAQIEQVLLALSINAIDAMPKGGNLWISSRRLPAETKLSCRCATMAWGFLRSCCRSYLSRFSPPRKWAKG